MIQWRQRTTAEGGRREIKGTSGGEEEWYATGQYIREIGEICETVAALIPALRGCGESGKTSRFGQPAWKRI